MATKQPGVIGLSKYIHYIIGEEKTDHTLIFQHIPKCGGMTLRGVVFDQYPDLHRTPRNKKIDSATKERVECIFGHFYYGDESKPPYGIAQEKTYITMLRHPLDRVISQFYYATKYKRIPKGKDILWYSKGRGNLMTQCLSGGDPYDAAQAIRNLRKFDYVGITEEMYRSIMLFAKALGWKVGNRVDDNVSEARPKDNSWLTTSQRKTLLAWNSKDVKLYCEAYTLFLQQCGRAGL